MGNLDESGSDQATADGLSQYALKKEEMRKKVKALLGILGVPDMGKGKESASEILLYLIKEDYGAYKDLEEIFSKPRVAEQLVCVLKKQHFAFYVFFKKYLPPSVFNNGASPAFHLFDENERKEILSKVDQLKPFSSNFNKRPSKEKH